MKKTPLRAKKPMNKVSAKQKAIKKKEQTEAEEMLERFGGKCMICGEKVPLEKNHTRDRKKFILTCHRCHFPDGYHKYLDDWDGGKTMSYEEARELW